MFWDENAQKNGSSIEERVQLQPWICHCNLCKVWNCNTQFEECLTCAKHGTRELGRVPNSANNRKHQIWGGYLTPAKVWNKRIGMGDKLGQIT